MCYINCKSTRDDIYGWTDQMKEYNALCKISPSPKCTVIKMLA